jgi:hypothetical protein
MIACMVALQIRHVPDAMRDSLAAQARAQGISLQKYLYGVVAREASSPTGNAALLREVRTWRFTDSPARLDDLQAVIDHGRSERSASGLGRLSA